MIPSRRRFLKIVAAQTATLALAGGPRIFGSSQEPKLRQWKGIVLGSEASIQLNSESDEDADRIIKRCVSEIQRLEKIFSLYDESSSLAQLNKYKYLDLPPAELVELLKLAQTIGNATRGVFDVTIQPIITAYRNHFSSTNSGLPADLELAKSAVDYRQIEIDRHRIRLLDRKASITLNGIAQGYITDQVALLLKKEGFGHTLIDLGEKRALGTHPTGRNWALGLANKFGIHDVAELNDTALSSSGGYGTSFDQSGKHHHLIDPRTGLAVNNHASVHVVADSAALADALSTSLATCKRSEESVIESQFPGIKVFRS